MSATTAIRSALSSRERPAPLSSAARLRLSAIISTGSGASATQSALGCAGGRRVSWPTPTITGVLGSRGIGQEGTVEGDEYARSPGPGPGAGLHHQAGG